MANNVNPSVTVSGEPVDASLVSYTHIIYALHSLSVLIGLTSAVTIIGSFIFGLPSIIAVIMNYARQSDARGTFLESHFRWQIRTFWFALLWAIVILAVSLPLMLIVVGLFTAWIGFVLLGIWVMYRIIRGWLALRDHRPVNP
ncbi:MAG: DUF4870 family protein [Steroidobacteraceae bacterium]